MLCPEWMVRLPVTLSRAAESSGKLQALDTEMRRVSPPTYSMPPPVTFWKWPPELQMILICNAHDSLSKMDLHGQESAKTSGKPA